MLLNKTIFVEWLLSSLTLFFILYVAFRLINKYNLLSEFEENHYTNNRDNLEELVNLEYAATQELEMKSDVFNTDQPMESFHRLKLNHRLKSNQSKHYHEILNKNHGLINMMKEIRNERYNHAVLVSQLSSYVSKNMNLNSDLLKAAGMYHEIFKILDIKNVQKGTKHLQDINFPEDLIHIIKEQYENPKSPKTLEALVLLLSDSIITTMDFIKQKQEKKNIKATKIVENVFNHHLKNGVFDDLPISLHEYRTLKEYYISYFKE
jgi:hypothetical protein